MSNFPAINRSPNYATHVTQAHADPVYRTTFEQGCILSRLRATAGYTRVSVQLRGVSDDDKRAVQSFEIATGYGAEEFGYVLPDDSVISARLTSPIRYQYESNDNTTWQIDFEIFYRDEDTLGTEP